MPDRSSEARASRQGENAPVYKNLARFLLEERGYGVGCGERVGRGSMARVSKTGRTSQPSLALTVTMKLIADRQCGAHLVRRRGEEVLKEKAGFYQEFCKFFSVGRRNDWLFQYFHIFLLFCVERFSRENVPTYGTQAITGFVRSLCSLFCVAPCPGCGMQCLSVLVAQLSVFKPLSFIVSP